MIQLAAAAVPYAITAAVWVGKKVLSKTALKLGVAIGALSVAKDALQGEGKLGTFGALDIFSRLHKFISEYFIADIFNMASNFVAVIAGFALLIMSSYLLLIFLNNRTQGFDEITIDFIKRFFIWTLVCAISLNPYNYILLAKAIYFMPDQMVSWFLVDHASVITEDFFDSAALLVSKSLVPINNFYMKLGSFELVSIIRTTIAYYATLISGYAFVIASFSAYLINKIFLGVVLLLGPLAIFMLLFPATRQFGMNWLGQALALIFSIVFALILSATFIAFITDYSSQLTIINNPNEIIKLREIEGYAITVTIINIIFLICLWRLPTIMSSIFSGMSSEGTVSGGMRAISSAISTTVRGASFVTPRGRANKTNWAEILNQQKNRNNSMKP